MPEVWDLLLDLYLMGAIILFHGPRGREEAVLWAEATGRLLVPADGGGTGGKLKVEVTRNMLELLGAAPVGDRIGTLVIGPMDNMASDAASDALLKALEECNTSLVWPALWAEDIGRVYPTIQSRTVERWCPARPGFEPEAPFIPVATTLCDAAIRGRVAAIIETLGENEGSETELLAASAIVLRNRDEWDLEARLRLWVSIRGALAAPVTRRSTLAAFLLGG